MGVLTLRPSLASTLPPSGCSPSTRGGQTLGAMETGRSSTKVVLRSFVLRLLRLPGRRSWVSSTRDPPGSSPSGLEGDPARRLEILQLLRERRRVARRLPLRKKRRKSMTRKRRKKRRRKSKREESPCHQGPAFVFSPCLRLCHLGTSSLVRGPPNIPYKSLLPCVLVTYVPSRTLACLFRCAIALNKPVRMLILNKK